MIVPFLVVAVLARAPSNQADLYVSAMSSYANGDVDAAASALASLTRQEIKRDAERMVQRAMRAPAEQRTRELETRLETAAMLHTEYAVRADLDANGTVFHIDMAHLLLSFDRERLTGTDPDRVRRREFVTRWTAVAAGILLFDGLDENASPIVEEALKLAPDDPKLRYWRGRVLEFGVVWHASPNIDHHAALLTGAGRNGSAFDLLQNARLWGPVEDAYRRVVEIDPTAYEAHAHLGYALYWQRRFAAATAEYQLARDGARDPRVIYIASLLQARLDEDQGETDAAAAAYNRAIAAVPTAQSAYVGLSALEMRRGNIQRARELTDQFTALPDKAQADDPWWSFHGTQVPSDDLTWLRKAVRR